jgi:acetylornithine/N-succinyldiaminopimelate aminotransferase
MSSKDTFQYEDRHMIPFFAKQPVSIERGRGVYVWDEEGNRYIDFTSGWGVTCLGHAHPAITKALHEQARKIIQNPNSGLTYSPARARLLSVLTKVLPKDLSRVFFTNSGAEANDAAIKLARKITGRLDVISMVQSFHGRTISTASATGQVSHRDKFKPLMPNYRFVPYNDIESVERALDSAVAAIIVEPIQGEGGVIIPGEGYIETLSRLGRDNGSLLIVDEIQTGFCRTGSFFAISPQSVEVDFLTMAKGIAGGFPFGGFAVTESVASSIEQGDHGGTYCGNPLGCAVAHEVVRTLVEQDICANVNRIGSLAMERLHGWHGLHPELIVDVRGCGLLLLIQFSTERVASEINEICLRKGLFVRQTQGSGIRLFPALNIGTDELEEGLAILEEAIEEVAGNS